MSSAFRIKPGVQLARLTPQMALGAAIVAEAYIGIGCDCVITSCSDGRHRLGSLHDLGCALDFRTRDLTDGIRDSLVTEIREALGTEFDVVLEADHLHVEWDP